MRQTQSRFVSHFVDQMYVILIGLGVASIAFSLDLQSSPVFHLLMSLFVTTVVLLYWWDWKDHFEHNVISSKSEFVVDLLILLTLLFLFRYYADPQALAIVFIVLGLLDLAWVANYLVQFGNEQRCRPWRWLAEKLLVVAVYGATYLALTGFAERISLLASGGMLAVAFVLVRLVGFRQMRRSGRLAFRPALATDCESIARINNSHYRAEGDGGFMISLLDVDLLEARVRAEPGRLFVVEDARGAILGFIETSASADDSVLGSLVWEDEALRQRFLVTPKTYVEKVGVVKGQERTGVGRFAYESLRRLGPERTLYALVAEQPVSNDASARFHESLGFEPAARFEAARFEGYDDYASRLFILWPDAGRSPGRRGRPTGATCAR